MLISINTFRSPVTLLRRSSVCRFLPEPPVATPPPNKEAPPAAARPAGVTPLYIAATQPPAAASPPPLTCTTATLPVPPAEPELETLHMQRTATNLARLETEQAAAPLPAAADASPPTSHSYAAVAGPACPQLRPKPPGLPQPLTQPKGAALTSPISVVVLQHNV